MLGPYQMAHLAIVYRAVMLLHDYRPATRTAKPTNTLYYTVFDQPTSHTTTDTKNIIISL